MKRYMIWKDGKCWRYNEDFIMLCYLASMIALYRHFDERYSNYKMMLLHGILCGIILNMKPNYIIFYIPIAIHLLITTLKDKNYINKIQLAIELEKHVSAINNINDKYTK